MEKWFEATKRTFLLDFQMPDSDDQMPIGQPVNLRNINPAIIVTQLHESKVKSLYVHAKDNQGNCYYNTKYGHKHTGIGEKDLMAEFSRECRKAGMNILYYVQLSRERRGNEVDTYAARNFDGSPHIIISAEEKPFIATREEAPVMCLMGPGRDYIINIVKELSENYDFDGFWLDCFAWFGRLNPCYCGFCKSKYYEDTWNELPLPDDKSSLAWKQYFTWRLSMNSKILHEIEYTIKRVNPKLTITHNGSAVTNWTNLDICDLDDYVTNEYHIYPGIGHLAFQCRQNQAVKAGKTYEIELWRFNAVPEHKMSREYQVRSVPHLVTEMSTVLANGGFVQYYDQILPDGSLDARSLQQMKKAFEVVEEMEPICKKNKKRIGYASLFWSKSTESFANQIQAETHMLELKGFSNAFIEKRIQHDVIYERNVQNGEFGDAKVLILPNVCCMSEKEAENIRKFVAEGGGVVATYRSSMADEKGKTRDNYILADLFGIDYIESMSYIYSYMKFKEEHALTQGLPLNWPISAWDKLQLKVSVRDEAKGIGTVMNPMRGMHMGYPAQEDIPYPPVVINQYGKGRVVYITNPIGECYHSYGHMDSCQLIYNAVVWAAGEKPPVELTAPDTVETVLWEGSSEKLWLLHLVNITPNGPVRTKGSIITQEIPLQDIKVLINKKVIKAIVKPQNVELKCLVVGGKTEICLPRLNIYSVIEIELE